MLSTQGLTAAAVQGRLAPNGNADAVGCHIHPPPHTMSTTTVFTNNRSQAVRLPANARLPPHVKRVEVRVRGAERIISPAGHTWDSFFASDAPQVSDDFLPQRGTQDVTPREAL